MQRGAMADDPCRKHKSEKRLDMSAGDPLAIVRQCKPGDAATPYNAGINSQNRGEDEATVRRVG